MLEITSKTRDFGNIYRTIYYKKQSSRQQIAEELGISLPTVTQNLKLLQKEGLIHTTGLFDSTGGRKANIYSCISNARYALGIDITQNHLSIVLIDLSLNILDRHRIRCPYKNTEEYYQNLGMEVETFLIQNQIKKDRLLGIGISMPVIIKEDQQTVSYAQVIQVPDNIHQRIQQHLPYPFLLFNDANCAGLAESRFFASDPIVYLFLGNSVGGAYMSGQKIYTGNNCRASEFGHMCIIPHGRKCYCGQKGCLDAYCSSKILSDFTDGDLKEFFEQLNTSGNPGFRRIFNEYLDYLSIAVKNLQMCYDCQVVLGGAVGSYMGEYLEEFRKKVSDQNPFSKDSHWIQVCHYRTEASAVGSAVYYINEFIENL